jgi:hypothetical protein
MTNRCTNCGRFVEFDADGFYDREERECESSLVACFCSESCADRNHERRMLRLVRRAPIGFRFLWNNDNGNTEPVAFLLTARSADGTVYFEREDESVGGAANYYYSRRISIVAGEAFAASRLEVVS